MGTVLGKPKFDLTGRRFSRLVALRCIEVRYEIGAIWECACDCGGKAEVRSAALRSQHTRSCGCLQREAAAVLACNALTVHGEAQSNQQTVEYKTWSGIKRRCFNKNDKTYQYYGARGITMCDEWVDNFEAFVAHVGRRPSPGHSIDRIDNYKGYEPGNVRWATREVQVKNKRATLVTVTAHNKTQSIAEWAKETGLKGETIRARLNSGWSDHDAVSVVLGAKRQTHDV